MAQTETIRSEILKNISLAEYEAFLTGVIRTIGCITLRKNGVELVLETDNAKVFDAVKPVLLACGVSDIKSKVKGGEAKSSRYTITVAVGDSSVLLNKLGILQGGFCPVSGLNQDKPYDDLEKVGMLKGLFAAGGTASFTDGEERQGYHLEFTVTDETLKNDLLEMLRSLGLENWHFIARKNNFGIYLKDRETIFEFLVLTGATKSALELQSAIALKELRNNLNRQNNIQSANMDKTVNASVELKKDIELLQECGKLDMLTQTLQLTARLRLENPESSILELAELAGCSKSGLSHRMKKLQTLAREEREKWRKV